MDERAMRIAHAQAKRVHTLHGGAVDIGELLGETYEWLAKHPDKVEDWLAQGAGGRAALSTSLFREAQRAALRERSRVTNNRPADYYHYPPPLVADLLPDALDESSAWPAPDPSAKGPSRPSEGPGRQIMLADVRTGFLSLSDSDRALLLDRYGPAGVPSKDLALRYGVTEQSLRRRLGRALTRLSDKLGGSPPWWDPGRNARSNSHSIAETRGQT